MGGVMHLGVERVWRRLGLELTAVPFRGAGQMLPVFLGGDITFYGGSLTGAMPALLAGTAKCPMLTTPAGLFRRTRIVGSIARTNRRAKRMLPGHSRGDAMVPELTSGHQQYDCGSYCARCSIAKNGSFSLP